MQLVSLAKSRTRLSDFPFTFYFPTLEKEMATHSSVLAWRIPGMGEPGGPPSMRSHRVGHDWSDLAAAAAVETIHHLNDFNGSSLIMWSIPVRIHSIIKKHHIPGEHEPSSLAVNCNPLAPILTSDIISLGYSLVYKAFKRSTDDSNGKSQGWNPLL